jgi:DNA polymerase-3 subunit delta'
MLLPTIRSRCRTLRFPALADEAVERILAAEAPQADAATRAAAAAAAAGSPGAALSFGEQDLAPIDALLRKYKGATRRVTIRDNGFEYEGQRFKTLTTVAKAITAPT